MSPLAVDDAVPTVAVDTAIADGDATGDDKAGRCGLGATPAGDGTVDTAVGVGDAAPPPHAATKISETDAHAATIALLIEMRRDIRARRTLTSPSTRQMPSQYIQASVEPEVPVTRT
ncbi:MAG: hypothetical protein NVSMB2_02860 [Chloroflexota bacterium]